MKVLHVITGLGTGGAEHQLRGLLQRTRHDADVVALYNPGSVAEMIEKDGTAVRDLGMASNTEVSALPRLAKIARSGGYDVVHTHLYRSCVYGRPAARLAGVPVVVATEHSIGETKIERRPMSRAVRALYLASERFSHATIAVSEVTRARLVRWGVPAEKIVVIPNGVDVARVEFRPDERVRIRDEFGVPAGTYLLGVLSRLDPVKRVDVVVEAVAPLLGDRRRLLVVGDGSERSRLEDLARRHGVSQYVIFAGERSDVGPVLSSLDLFVTASDQETFGLSTLEALANGTPALFTTCPALDGVAVNGARRVPGDVERLRREVDTEIEVGDRDRVVADEVSARYGMDEVARRVDDLYELLLARSGRRVLPAVLARAGGRAATTVTTGGPQ